MSKTKLLMKNFEIFSPIVLSIFAFVFMAFVGEPEDINKAIKQGDTAELVQNMNSTVELVILDKENVYSNIQAGQILKQFFANHHPLNFKIIHNGGTDISQYYIGILTTNKGIFRVYYLLKTKSTHTLLYQLRIETDE